MGNFTGKIVQLHCSNMKNQLGLIEIFKMPSFKEKQTNNIKFNSDPFYTYPRGYKVVTTLMQMVTRNKKALMSQCLFI